MTLDQLTQLAEIAAGIGVVVSLVMLIRQLRQTEQQLKRADISARADTARTASDLMLTLASDPILSSIVSRGAKGIENLEPSERPRFYSYCMSVSVLSISLNSYEWVKYDKTTDPFYQRLWSTYYYNVSQAVLLLNTAGGRAYLARFHDLFAPEALKFLKACAGLGPWPESQPPPAGLVLPERLDLKTDAQTKTPE